MSYSYERLLAKFERAQTIQGLQLCAEEAKTAPEADKRKLREVWGRRVLELGGGCEACGKDPLIVTHAVSKAGIWG